MNKLYRFVSFGLLVVAMLSLVVGFAVAQDGPAPGTGGTIVWGNQRGSANIGPLVPIRCSGVDCADPNGLMYVGLIGLDPSTLTLQPWAEGANFTSLATGWEAADDGVTYTVSLRDDLTWNDGTPITAKDVFFTWSALQNAEAVGLSSSYAPAAQDIVAAEIVDDHTINFTFASPSCLAVNRMALVTPLPAHAYGYEPGAEFDWATLNGHPADKAPAVTFGPFKFSRLEPGTAVYLESDQNYPGDVTPTGLVYLDVPDYNIMAERLLAGQDGDVNFMFEFDNSVLPTLTDGGAQVFSAPGTIWHYMAINIADPENPQNGLDEAGNPIDQGSHPIFGDKRVRQAFQHAVPIDEITQGVWKGNASPMTVGTIPNAFSLHPELERRAYDLDVARAILDEAGWKSTGDPLVDGGDGLRTCDGCMYAEAGTPLAFEIMNVGDTRNDVAVVIQNEFAKIGVEVTVTVLDFNTMYDGNMGTQTYDAAIAGWRGGVPFNADQRNFFGAENDIAGDGSANYGFNFTSWYNAEFEELSEFIATGAAPDCDLDAIKEAAYKIQEIQYDEQPYIFLYALNSSYAASPAMSGFNPFPAQALWNVETWYLEQ